ncbi:MAG: sigma-70 family RNA polymerase sigma factor [Deltaproteobacteria bacterium]
MAEDSKNPPVEEDEGATAHAPAASDDSGPSAPTPAPPPPRKRRAKAKAVKKARSEDDSSASSASDSSDDGDGSDVVVDVGTTPSLPSRAVTTTAASVPAVRARDRASALDAFLAQVGKYPVLNPEEERELTMAYYERQDPVAARKLVVHNLRLVVKMAYKYRRAWASVLDLIQEGNVGLVEAVDRFDPFKGAKFSTYATFWIRAYMLRYLLEHSRTVRISRTRVGRKLFFQLARERAKLRAQGIEPGPKLLAERLNVKQADLEEVVKHMDQSEVRLDAPAHTDDVSGATILDGFSAVSASPEAEAFRNEFANDVSEALAEFATTLKDDRERMAWEKHLMSEDPMSLSELGEQFGVTKQRMGQIVQAMRKRLKQHLINRLGPDVELGYNLDAEA